MIEQVIRKAGSSTAIDILVTTGSKREEISGFDEWRKRLIVRIKERPMEGKANAAVTRFFSELFGIPRRGVRITSGQKTNQKTLEVDRAVEEVTAALKAVLGQD